MTEARGTGRLVGACVARAGAATALAMALLSACATLRPVRPPASPVPLTGASVGRTAAESTMRKVVSARADSVAQERTQRVTAAAQLPVASDSIPPMTPTQIVAEVTEVFGAPPAPPAPVDGPTTGPVWDIDVRSYETRDRVEHFVSIFSGRAKPEFQRSMQRQTRYGELIRSKLREGGLPEDMTYLALIESWYDPHAYSRAAAVGMWQFMTGTARGVGMRVDWWIDERRDPVRATAGAVRYLKGLKAQFGSLYLAAAAYNGGDGRVSRGLARYAGELDGVEGDDRFFTLADTKYLRAETRDYVPKLIAAALIGKEPGRYGVTVDSLPPFLYDSVLPKPLTSLAAVATASGATLAEIRELNPHILRGTTPPEVPVWVRIPPRTGTEYAERFDAVDPALKSAITRVESRKGESMSSIAKKHGMTSRQLAWYNPRVARLKSGNLRAGQAILVPTHATLSAAFDVPDPAIARYPKRAKAPAKATARGTVKKVGATKPAVGTKAARPATKAPAKKSAGPTKRPAIPSKQSVTPAQKSSPPATKRPR